jgi:hypothetical protein
LRRKQAENLNGLKNQLERFAREISLSPAGSYSAMLHETVAMREAAPDVRHDALYMLSLSPETASEAPVAFKPNYGRDRAEHARAARAKNEEKQRKKDERTALRKVTRVESEAPSDETQS